VTIEAPFYRVLPTHQIYVSRSLYNRTESVNNMMFFNCYLLLQLLALNVRSVEFINFQ